MTRLLVSVRSADEARTALAGGADIIDVKEPTRGSLGAATPQVWREVADAVGQARPLSAALGELLEFQPAPGEALQGYRYAKLGLAGCVRVPDWREQWQAAFAHLPQGTAAVAVAYADHEAAHAPPPQEVCAVGQGLGCRALLVDTFDKQQGDVFDALGTEKLAELFQLARSFDLRVVLAGSLKLARLPQALNLWPDYVAVRGAVCHHSRAGELDEKLVRRWAALLYCGRSPTEPSIVVAGLRPSHTLDRRSP